MTQKQFYIFIIACNVVLLFVYVFKQNSIISLRHEIQKNEIVIARLQQKQEQLFNVLQKMQQHTTIKKRAEKDLGMRKKNLQQLSPVELSTA